MLLDVWITIKLIVPFIAILFVSNKPLIRRKIAAYYTPYYLGKTPESPSSWNSSY